MIQIFTPIFFTTLLLLTSNVLAVNVYKCVAPNGDISFGTSQCASSDTQEQLNLNDEANVLESNVDVPPIGEDGKSNSSGGFTAVGSGSSSGGGSSGGGSSGGGSSGGGSSGGGSSGGGSSGGGSSNGSESSGGSESSSASENSSSTTNSSAGNASNTSIEAGNTEVTPPQTNASNPPPPAPTPPPPPPIPPLPPTYAFSISSVTINGAQDEITILGSSFGAGPNVILYDDFENGTPGSDVALFNDFNAMCSDTFTTTIINTRKGGKGPLVGCWTEYPSPVEPRYTNTDAYSGTSSMQVYDSGIPTYMRLRKTFLVDPTEIYISYRLRVPDTTIFPGNNFADVVAPKSFPIDSAWKFTWLTDGGTDTLIPNICLPTYTGFNVFQIAGNDLNVQKIDTNDWWSWDHWMKLGFWLRANSVDPTFPGDVHFQSVSLDRGYYEQKHNVPVFDEDGPSVKKWSEINIPGWIKISGNNNNPLYDDIYIAVGPNAAKRVEIGNSNTYSTSTVLELQLPNSWSGNQIKVSTTNKDKFGGDFKTGFLYITDGNGIVNENGIPIN